MRRKLATAQRILVPSIQREGERGWEMPRKDSVASALPSAWCLLTTHYSQSEQQFGRSRSHLKEPEWPPSATRMRSAELYPEEKRMRSWGDFVSLLRFPNWQCKEGISDERSDWEGMRWITGKGNLGTMVWDGWELSLMSFYLWPVERSLSLSKLVTVRTQDPCIWRFNVAIGVNISHQIHDWVTEQE